MEMLLELAVPPILGVLVWCIARGLPTPADALAAAMVYSITAAWDIVLRDMAMGNLHFLGIERMQWIVDLRGYFKATGIIEAAAVAGGVGVGALALIGLWTPPGGALGFAAWVFVISALYGLPMRAPVWFQDLQKYYYNKQKYLTFLTDGLSGLIVLITFATLGLLLTGLTLFLGIAGVMRD
jgi:hypothetical protein